MYRPNKHTGKTIFLFKYTGKFLNTQEKLGFFINGKYTGRKAMSGT
jgi:hypothetical protein